MMRPLLALSLLLATPCWAQADAKLFAAGKALELVGPTLAQAVIAAELCGIGDATPWKKAVAAIDRRHARCIAEDPTWKGLTEKPDALAGTFAFDSFMNTRGEEAFLREQSRVPREALDEFLAWANWVRALGDDPRWVEAPCAEFWPAWPR